MKSKFGTKKVLLVVAIMIFALVGLTAWYTWAVNQDNKVTTYEQCALEADAVIQESYPEVCVYKDQSFTNPDQVSQQVNEYTDTTQIPTDWAKHTDTTQNVSFFIPPSWNVEFDTKGNTAQCDYEFGYGPWEQSYYATVCINNANINEVVEEYENNYIKSAGITNVLTREKIIIDGLNAYHISYDQGFEGIENQYFIEANNKTYTMPVVNEFDDGVLSANDSLTVFESFTFK
jgi:hypothetical protein